MGAPQIPMECFAGIPEMIYCLIPQVFGELLLGSVVVALIGAYLLYRAGLSFTASIPLAFLLLFGLYWMVDTSPLQPLMGLILLGAGAVLAIVFIRWFYR